jgi:hypothetical protein
MTQQEKDLLLKDLCARLPYGVKVKDTYYNYDEPSATIWLLDLNAQKVRIYADEGYQSIEYIKPYLFPLSSMSEDLKNELYTNLTELELKAINDEIEHSAVSVFEIDFYHKHHIDYRGLIPMGLAIDATELNVY